MGKKSKLSAILLGKCPQCHQGNLFDANPYHLKKMMNMNKRCPHCDVNFEKEPRFFDGAMYISYAMSVGLFLVSAFIIYHTVEGATENTYLIAIIAEVVLLFPVMFRYSRILYLYAFGGLKYKGEE